MGASLSQKERESYQTAQWQRILLTMQEIGMPSLRWEDLLEKEMATHASIFAWEIPWTEEPGGLQSKGLQRVRLRDWARMHMKRNKGPIHVTTWANLWIIYVKWKQSVTKTTYHIILFSGNAQNREIYRDQMEKAMAPPLQYSCLENPMDGGAWWATVHGVAKSLTWLRDFTFTFHFHALEKERATHSSILAWRIPGTEEPGGLQSMGSHRVRHDWSDLAAAAA